METATSPIGQSPVWALMYLQNQWTNWCDIVLNKNTLNEVCFGKQKRTFQKSSESVYLHIHPNAAPSSSDGIRMFVNSIPQLGYLKLLFTKNKKELRHEFIRIESWREILQSQRSLLPWKQSSALWMMESSLPTLTYYYLIYLSIF